MKKILGLTFLFAVQLITPLTRLSAAELAFASPFTDNAVLQRDAATPVWGLADPNEEVTVAFGGQTKTTVAEANGKWSVKLDPMPASAEGRELAVRSSLPNREAKISNVLVGDVWLCSGQSNMHFTMKKVENAKAEIAAAENPAIRFFYVKEQFAQQPASTLKGDWKPVSPTTVVECSAVAYYFAKDLQQKLGVPIGLLISTVGGTRIETWTQHETLLKVGISESLINSWKDYSPEEFEKIVTDYRAFQFKRDNGGSQGIPDENNPKTPSTSAEPLKPPKLKPHSCPSALHNGMIAPLQPYAIRGVIWYQGEANFKEKTYDRLLPALIAEWRRTWGDELPFLFAQLPPYNETPPLFRELQHNVWRNTPHTAMAVTMDVGEAANIHPNRKRPVGERLALAARAICYGEPIEYSGPIFESLSVKNNQAVLSFSHVGKGLMAKGDSLKGFVLAGKEGKFVPAQAVIEGQTVVVTSDQIAQPVAVRYGWENVPVVNLYNQDGLPAAPFRSDRPETDGSAAQTKNEP